MIFHNTSILLTTKNLVAIMSFMVLLSVMPSVIAEESTYVELYQNQSKVILERGFVMDTTQKSIILDNILQNFLVNENQIDSILFQNVTLADHSRLADKLRANAEIVDCTTNVNVLYELILPTTNQTKILETIVGKNLLDETELDKSFQMNFDSIDDISIRVRVEEDQTKSQVMLCDDRMSFRFDATEEDTILSLLEDNTGLNSTQIQSIWSYYDTTITQQSASTYEKPMSAEEIKEEAEKTMTQAEKQLAKAEGGMESAMSGGCLIATATFGTELSPKIQSLRETRDNIVMQTESGKQFMQGFNEIYYSFSPQVADLERQNPTFRYAVELIITPMLSTLSILNYLDIDSEAEMVIFGSSIITLNAFMYFGVPTVIIFGIRKRFKKNYSN